MRRYVLAALASVVIIGVALVLSSGDDDADDAARVAGGSTTTIAGAAPTATTAPVGTAAPRGARGNGTAVTFAFAGDVNFPEVWDTEDGPPPTAPPLGQQVRDDPKHVLDPVAPTLRQADLAVVNLETAITDRGEPVAGKNYHFRSPGASFSALKAAGVDVVNMANNHALDYGPVGLQDTFAAITDSGLPVTGIGHDAAEAYRPFRTTIRGQRIAVLERVRLARARTRRRVVGDRHAARDRVLDRPDPPPPDRGGSPPRGRHARRVPALGHRGHVVRVGSATGPRHRAPRRRRRHHRGKSRPPGVRCRQGRPRAGRLRPGQLRVLARRRRIGPERRSSWSPRPAGRSTTTRGSRPASPTAWRRRRPEAAPRPISPSGTIGAAAAVSRPDR